jgi:hypothetical protein
LPTWRRFRNVRLSRNGITRYSVNGTATFTSYDDARRIDLIEHKNGATNLLTLDYNYTPDGLIDRIDQTDTSGGLQ